MNLLTTLWWSPCSLAFLWVHCSDSYIVRVKAVVMTRDDSSGGWLAQDGCLSRVGVCRLLPAELLGRNTFLIHGERLKDRQVSRVGGFLKSSFTLVGKVLKYPLRNYKPANPGGRLVDVCSRDEDQGCQMSADSLCFIRWFWSVS